MGIWIRSQNKKHLSSTTDIMLISPKVLIDEMTEYRSLKYVIKCDHTVFGEFTTEEQAMQVMEEITKLLSPKMIVKLDTILSKEDLRRYQIETERIPLSSLENLEYMPIEMFYQIPEDKVSDQTEVLK